MPNEKPDSFQCGPFEVARNPDVRSFVEKLNRLREAVDACRVQPGVGYTVSRSSGGTTLSIKASAGGVAAPSDPHPFQVTTSVQQETIHFTVHKESYVGGDYVPKAGEAISTGQRKISSGSPIYIWLNAKIGEQLEVTALKLESGLELPKAFLPEGDGPQTDANLVLATLTSRGIVQAVRQNLVMVLVNLAGYPAVYPAQTLVVL